MTGRGRPIVLIHGLSGSSRWWRRNLSALTREHQVFVLDLTGYGSARRQRALGVRASARIVAEWLRQSALTEVTLIGHSMGGHIAIHVAALAPQRVDTLILAGASGLLKVPLYRSVLNLPRALVSGRKRFLPQVFGDALRAGPLNLLRSGRDLLKDSVQDILPEIQARTLIIWGERDALVPLPVGQMLAGAIRGARLEVIPRAGHIVMVDDAERFNTLVLDFIGEAARSGAEHPTSQPTGTG
ncbi:alpha/beta fold hydrolase [Deinococcus koreensis]|uniref:alpha/beta fold hydrolase n=1 Tax=Deinococcus koreensis TaxID=2054903 RepID=UPI001FAF3885|nr:alpha/beta fold hydrolase [Deinococcus koreensis]